MASDQHKIQLLNFIGKDLPITMSFRSWELYEYPLLPTILTCIGRYKRRNFCRKPQLHNADCFRKKANFPKKVSTAIFLYS